MKKQAIGKGSVMGVTPSDLPSQKGFTLVELSIVLVIIGLIIGGILKGQELIANAQIKNVVSQSQSYQAAFVSFRDKYNGLPGDLVNAQLLIPNCTLANTCSPGATGGDGNGNIGVDVTAAFNGNVSAGLENLAFWQQLAAARFIGGVVLAPTGALAYGNQFPNAESGGGFQIVYEGVSGRHALRLAGATGVPAAATGALRADQALQVDTVLDDGRPITGSIFTNATISSSTTCFAGTPAIYTAAQAARSCNLVINVP